MVVLAPTVLMRGFPEIVENVYWALTKDSEIIRNEGVSTLSGEIENQANK